MNKVIGLVVCLTLILVACNSKKGEAFAKITERKHVEGGKLHISYSFTNEGKLYNGDTTIGNIIVPNDSVLVTFPPENPAESKLRIP